MTCNNKNFNLRDLIKQCEDFNNSVYAFMHNNEIPLYKYNLVKNHIKGVRNEYY